MTTVSPVLIVESPHQVHHGLLRGKIHAVHRLVEHQRGRLGGERWRRRRTGFCPPESVR